MNNIQTLLIPELGDFDEVPIIEILVAKGDIIDKNAPLITLESDKATMDIPSTHAGTVSKVLVSIGQTVSEGTAIVELSVPSDSIRPSDEKPDILSSTTDNKKPEESGVSDQKAKPDESIDLIVIGAGPGGYTAAFRAADLGLKTVLIERYSTLGGVCLNVGCIPSKALLHAAKVIEETHDASTFGLDFNEPIINREKLLKWKDGIIGSLTGGLKQLAKQRKIRVINGIAKFTSEHSIELYTQDAVETLAFKQAIIATGSQAIKIPGFPYNDPRLIDSTGALDLSDIPKTMLVIGGGIIGLEMATVYKALGSQISVVEMSPALIPGADSDLVRPLQRRITKQYANIWLNTKVTAIKALKTGLKVYFEGDKAPSNQIFDKVLVAVGRAPNGAKLSAEKAGVEVNEHGFIEVNAQMRSNVAHIFAIGDVVGQPMLAHKAAHEGKVAAEVAAGLKSGFDASVIPSVAYTDPEIAWVGLTEIEAKNKGIDYGVGKFPWAASGRSLSLNRKDGMTKALFENKSKRIIGCGIVGPNAGDLIAEAALAIEMGADAEDIALTIHPHPTLSETIGFAAEAFEGTITDLYQPKKL